MPFTVHGLMEKSIVGGGGIPVTVLGVWLGFAVVRRTSSVAGEVIVRDVCRSSSWPSPDVHQKAKDAQSRSSLITVIEKVGLPSAAFPTESSVEETTTLGFTLVGQATGSPSCASATLLTTSREHANIATLARIRKSVLIDASALK
jgi:hypothetical protein